MIPQLSYAVTRKFTPFFSLVAYALLGIVAVVLLVLNIASTGYEVKSVSRSNFNATQSFWYSRFIPDALRPKSGTLCQPYTYHVGDTFETTNAIFTWRITDVVQSQNEDIAGLWQQGRFASVPYSNVPLNYCDVTYIYFTVDLYQDTVTGQVRMECQLPIPFIAEASFSSSHIQARSTWAQAPDNYGYSGLYPQDNVTSVLQELGTDVMFITTNMITNSEDSETSPVVLSATYLYQYCPAVFTDEPGWCDDAVDDAVPQMRFNAETVVLKNGSFVENDVNQILLSDPLRIPAQNFVQAMYAAARADLGSYYPNNMFQNTTVVGEIIQDVTSDGSMTWELDGAKEFMNLGNSNLTGLPLANSGAGVIQTSYLCNYHFVKTPASWFFAVSSGTISTLLAVMNIFMLVSVWWVKRVEDNNICIGHHPAMDGVQRVTFMGADMVQTPTTRTQTDMKAGATQGDEEKAHSPSSFSVPSLGYAR